MNKLIKNSFVIALTASGILAMNSCKKVEVDDINKKQSHAKVYESLPKMQTSSINQAVKLQTLFLKALNVNTSKFRLSSEDLDFSGCATITKDTSSLPYTMHIDFGPSGCLDSDGKLFTGSVDFVYNGSDIDIPGTYIHGTLNNVTVGVDYQLYGTLKLENFGLNGSGNYHGRLDVDLTTYNKVSEIELQGSNTFFIEVADVSGDFHTIFTGGGSGLTSDGFSYTQTITQPLTSYNCDGVFVEGILQLESPSFDTKFVDYGDGTCDDVAYVIQGSNRNYITLD
jgi:hypothetical protein